jgi:hypothetical protein
MDAGCMSVVAVNCGSLGGMFYGKVWIILGFLILLNFTPVLTL